MIKSIFLYIFILFQISETFCQLTSGITHTPDTSYTIQSEFKKHKKTFPFLEIASASPVNYITIEKDIVFCKTKERDLKIDAFYINEKSQEKRKAIIFIHGGGWRSGNKSMHYPLVKEMVMLGYVCFTPEYRLSTDALYPAAIHDIKSAIRWVRKHAKQYSIDQGAIIVAGHSSGGELAAFAGTTNGMKEFEGNGCELQTSAKANAVIDLDGTLAFIHPESGEGDDSKKISAATYWFGYSKTENASIWKEAAPLTHVGKNSPPFLFINSGVERMHAGRKDFIRILNKNHIYSEVKIFEGAPHTFLLFHPWFDSVVVYMDCFIRRLYPEGPKPKKIITVAPDGSGNFKTVTEAIRAIPLNNKKWTEINIKEGEYKEKLFIDSLKPYILMVGENKLTTILTWNDHTGKIAPSGDTINTRTSSSFRINADNFIARDLTFQNDAGFNAGQAVAVESDGDKVAFYNCRFIGFQDVLFTNKDNSRQYFENCYIEGTTDFIFGSSTVWFERCHIHSKKNSHVTAAATPQDKPFGYVFNRCALTGDTSLHSVSLGRPWRPYARVVYLNSYIGEHIKPEGWSVWNNNENHKTAFFAEFGNYGPGSNLERRLSWVKKLSGAEAKNYTVEKVLAGWDIKNIN